MVSIAVSEMAMTELIFIDPAMKVNGQYYAMSYCLSRCCQRSSMLQAIRLSFNKTTLHLIVPRTPLNCYRTKRRTSLVLISGHQTAQALYLVDYKVWGLMQQSV